MQWVCISKAHISLKDACGTYGYNLVMQCFYRISLFERKHPRQPESKWRLGE